MRSTHDNPIDPLGTLGPAVKPAAPAAPDQAKAPEQQTDRPLIADESKAIETIAETLRKKGATALDPDLAGVMAVTCWGVRLT